MYDKIFAAYHEARSCIRKDLVNAGDTENVKDDLNGLDKAVSAVLRQRTIERNQLLVSIAKSKFARNRDDKVEKATKPEGLVRLFDLLIQNTSDLSDLVTSRRDSTPEEVAFAEEFALKNQLFRAERCLYLAKSYSLAGKRAEAYVFTLLKLKAMSSFDMLYHNSRSNICIERAAGIMEEEKAPEKLTKGAEVFLLESSVADPNTKGVPHIEPFPPAFQAVPRNPIVLDMAFNSIEFPSLESRMKKEKK
ncbi:hypothetical protein MKX03_029553, partial [Papaver bracteatum]